MEVRLPYEGEDISSLPAFDFTKLNAVNTCPRWGVIRYGHHLTASGGGRAMALEAGEACHQVFAAVRLFDLLEHGKKLYPDLDLNVIVFERGKQLFGVERIKAFLELTTDPGEDERTRIMRGGLHILETSGFYDDPSDKRRTIDKLSEACIAYIDRYEFGKSVPLIHGNFVGVENAFELVVEYTNDAGVRRKCRFYGRIDGVAAYRNDIRSPIVEENKTASRLNDAWQMSFETSHQVTGYMVAASVLSGLSIDRARIYGLAIPQPRMYDEGLQTITVKREALQYEEWMKWFIHTAELYFEYFDKPLDAPMYTGSCNRYFRPCSFVPLCASRSEEEKQEIYDMFVVEEWSPLHEKSQD